jgi:hypothetical protein
MVAVLSIEIEAAIGTNPMKRSKFSRRDVPPNTTHSLCAQIPARAPNYWQLIETFCEAFIAKTLRFAGSSPMLSPWHILCHKAPT